MDFCVCLCKCREKPVILHIYSCKYIRWQGDAAGWKSGGTALRLVWGILLAVR
mgnify:CR=1 FL=1